MWSRYWLMLLGCWLLVGPGHARTRWQRDAVLSQVLVQQMATDRLGYRWVAADEGVYRYDGYELVPLRKLLAAGSTAPPDLHVRCLLLDRHGLLWLGAEKGLFCFNPQTNALRRVADRAGTYLVLLFKHPRTGHLWVIDGDGTLCILDPAHPDRPLFPPRHLRLYALMVQADAAGNGAWVTGASGEVVQLAANGRPCYRLQAPEVVVPLPGTKPLRLLGRTARYAADGAGGSLRETARWLPPDFSVAERPSLTDSTVEWITPQGYVRVRHRPGSGPAAVVQPLLLDDTGTQPLTSLVLEYDALGTRWAYSRTWRGCYKQRPSRHVMQPLLRQAAHDGAGSIPLASARAIARLPDGRLLVSTYDSVWVQTARMPAGRLVPLREQASGRPLGAIFNAVATLPSGTVLVVCPFRGFNRLDPATGALCPLPVPPASGPAPSRYLSLLCDRQGRVWGGAESGLFRPDPGRHRSIRYAGHRPGFALHSLYINAMAEDAAGRGLWLATNGGLYWLDPNTGRLHRYGDGPATTGRALPTNDMLCVAAAGPGRAWVGTRTDGLLLVDVRAGWLRQVGPDDGLPSPTVASLLLRHDTVWAGTFEGLVRYVPGSQSLMVLGEPEGLADAELNRYSAFADPATGRLWFGGVGGVAGIRPADLHPVVRQAQARLLATALSGPGATTDSPGWLRVLTAGRLPATLRLGAAPTDFVELRLAITDFLAPAAVQYSYRLRRPGAAAELPWLPTPRRLRLQGLPAGDYIIDVRAETAGQFVANTLHVPLQVARVWWQHPAVTGLAALLLLGLGYLLYWAKLWRQRREARLRESLAANLHDEVGALLTRINLQAQLLRDQHRHPLADEPERGAGFERLLTNSAAAVQTMRDVVWSIDARADSAGALLDRMREHLDQLGDVVAPTLTLHAAGLPDALPIPAVLRQHLYLIFKEAVTNAVRHAAGATEIRARLVRQAGVLELEVVDDGTLAATRSPVRASGLGLRSMAQRARAIGGSLHTGPRPDGQPGYRVRVCVRL